MTGKMSKSEIKNLRAGLLFTSPILIGFIIFVLGPMVVSLCLSFTDYGIVNKPNFVGIENYKVLFEGRDYLFYQALKVTIYYVALSVPLNIIYSFIIALLLNNNIKGLAFFRTVFYLPSIVPVVATSVIWIWLLNPDFGLFNTVLKSMGLPGSMWIYSEKTAIPSLVMMGLWSTGSTMIIFLAGLQDVPKSLYEAVDVDGGNFWHKLTKITMPLMTPVIFFNLVMGLINGFQTFSQAYVMTKGGPSDATLFYVFYLYREAFQNTNMAKACAIAWVLFIIIMLLTGLTFKSSNKWVNYDK